jgi:hypothetical protein
MAGRSPRRTTDPKFGSTLRDEYANGGGASWATDAHPAHYAQYRKVPWGPLSPTTDETGLGPEVVKWTPYEP